MYALRKEIVDSSILKWIQKKRKLNKKRRITEMEFVRKIFIYFIVIFQPVS